MARARSHVDNSGTCCLRYVFRSDVEIICLERYCYEDFLPCKPLPTTELDMNGEAAGVFFFLFLSAFGFFFSRLLLNCPFAISSSLWGWTQFSSFKPR